MRYFSDEKLAAMREEVKKNGNAQSSGMYLAYLSKIEDLDRRNDKTGDCREALLAAIADLERFSENYIHRGRANRDDEDNDAFEYENYDFKQDMD